MRKKKLLPFAFIGALIVVVIFIVGVQYGRKVAEVDKTIHYLISITPTKAVTPSPLPSIVYNSYEKSDCGVSFLYPSDLKEVFTSSLSAKLANKSGSSVALSCEKNNFLLKSIDMHKTATASVTIENKDIDASKSGDLYIFAVTGKKRKPVNFVVSSSLLALIEKTLKIVK